MSIVDRVLERLGYIKASGGIDTPAFLRAGLNPYAGLVPDYSLAANQAELYQRLSWVYIAVKAVAQTAAGATFEVKQRVGEKSRSVINHPFEVMLQHPNPLQSRFEFLESTFGYRELTGNAYWWLNRPTPEASPTEMWVIPAQQIVPVPDERLYLKGYLYDPGDGSTPIPLETWEIAHFRRFHPLNRFVGLSPIEALAVAATGDLAMAKWNTNYFAKDNAKMPGALVFADAIPDAAWEKLKSDTKEQHGGTERKLLMLRNAGQKGVSWISFGASQKDMEFLAGREFSKEEIYAAIAPGLASVLAINATEANSMAGKATLMDMAIWPMHQAVAEKITNDVLPAYGENLVGEFEDVRIPDRAMDLAERQAAAQVMTVAEIREKYHDLPPIGDERDLHVTGIGAAPTAEPEAPAEDTSGTVKSEQIFAYHLEQGVVDKNEARQALGLPPAAEDTKGKERQELLADITLITAAANTGVPEVLKKALEIVGIEAQVEKPTPAPALPSGEPLSDEDEPEEEEESAAMKADLKRWQKKAIKAVKAGKAAAVAFDTDDIPAALKASIAGALEAVKSVGGVASVFAGATAWEGYP